MADFAVIPIAADGSAALSADGSLILGDASIPNPPCCCEALCSGPCCSIDWLDYSQPGTSKNGQDLLRFAWDGEVAGQPFERMHGMYANGFLRGGPNPRRCRRLLVYEGVTIVGDAITGGGAATPDYILTTNANGYRSTLLDPDPLPFETAPGSGIDLDTEPYWFETCRRGGWADVEPTHWHKPTLTEIEARRVTGLADGTWRYLILVSYVSYKFADGTYAIPVNKGSARLLEWIAEKTA
jgi:hypothetical protein